MAYIDTIYGVGDDALGYEFQISFPSTGNMTGTSNLSLRTTTINIPEISVGEYEYDYKSEKLVKPNGKITTPKEFDFEFRIDKNYNLYQVFRNWSALITNPSTGGYSADTGVLLRESITVSAGYSNSAGVFTASSAVWVFAGCWPKRIGALTLDNQAGDPLMCQITFGYLSMTPPEAAVAGA